MSDSCDPNTTTTTTKSLQSCPTLCHPIDGSPPGSPIPGILQARTVEWVAISFSNAWKWKVKVKSLSHVQPSVTPWTAAFQAPLSMGFSRQEDWRGVPLPSPCDPDIKHINIKVYISIVTFKIYYLKHKLCLYFSSLVEYSKPTILCLVHFLQIFFYFFLCRKSIKAAYFGHFLMVVV